MRLTVFYTLLAMSLTIAAADCDQDKPFGYCTRTSRTDAASIYQMYGGGCYTYPIPKDFAGKVVVLKSNGQDMRKTIEDAIENSENNIIVLDGSNGDFVVSSNVEITTNDKTLLGINHARIRTQWYVTDDIRRALNTAGVPGMSTNGGGGALPNGHMVKEEAEYNTRKTIIEMTGDTQERYRESGILSLRGCRNIIIRNIAFVGPGAIDVGGNEHAVLGYVYGIGLDEPDVAVDARAFVKPAFFEGCVGFDGNYVVAAVIDVVGDVVLKIEVAALLVAEVEAVDPYLRIAEHALKQQRNLLAEVALRDVEVLAIPSDGVFGVSVTDSLVAVAVARVGGKWHFHRPIVRQVDVAPIAVVEVGGCCAVAIAGLGEVVEVASAGHKILLERQCVSEREFPVGVQQCRLSLCLRRNRSAQHCQNDCIIEYKSFHWI